MKIDFSVLRKKKILIYDGISLTLFKQILPNQKFNVYYNRGESINFWVFLTTFLQFKFFNYKTFKKYYKINYILKCSPKVIITFIDNNPAFYKLKNFFPNIITISIQNGYRSKESFKQFTNKKTNKYLCDYYFIFADIYKKIFSKFIKAKFIALGSLKMNHIGKINFKKKKELLFISQSGTLEKKISKIELILLKYIIKICDKRKIKINILCKKNVKKLFLSSFKNFKNKNIIESDNMFLPYRIIQQYDLKIFINSTLGFESLSIGEKIYSISFGSNYNDFKKYNLEKKIEKFGYLFHLKDEGYCWDNKINKEKIEKKILYLMKLSQNEWDKINNLKKKFMAYDLHNSKLINLLNHYKCLN